MNAAHSRAVLMLVFAALCWSIAGILIKFVGASWPGLAVAGARAGIAAAFLIATNRGLRFGFTRDEILGAVTCAACTMLFCVATTLTTAANAILLQYTAPIWVALLGAWFLGERATRADWLTIAAAFGGMVLFFADGLALANTLGNVLALLSGVCFAAMTLLLRRQKDRSPIDIIIAGNLLAFVVGLPWVLKADPLPASGWLALAVLGIVQLGIPYWLYVKAIRHVTALEAVLIPIIEPVLNPVWVFLASRERPSRYALLGGCIVIVAVTARALVSIRAGRRTTAPVTTSRSD